MPSTYLDRPEGARVFDWKGWLAAMAADPDRWHLVRRDYHRALASNIETRRASRILRDLPPGKLRAVALNHYTDEMGQPKADIYAMYVSDPSKPLPPAPRTAPRMAERGNRSVRVPARVFRALKRAGKDRGQVSMRRLGAEVIQQVLDRGTDYAPPQPKEVEPEETVNIGVETDTWQAFADLAAHRGTTANALARYELAKLAATIDPTIDPREFLVGR